MPLLRGEVNERDHRVPGFAVAGSDSPLEERGDVGAAPGDATVVILLAPCQVGGDGLRVHIFKRGNAFELEILEERTDALAKRVVLGVVECSEAVEELANDRKQHTRGRD